MKPTETQRTFTPEQSAAMYDMLRTLEHGLQRTNALRAQQVTALLDRIDAHLNTQALDTPQAATEPAREPATGRFKLDVFVTGRHIVIEYAQENPYKGQLFPSVDAAKKAITRDYGEHEAEQAAAALNADSTGQGGE